MNLIKSLKYLDITEENNYIERAIKYLEKISRTQDCYNNSKKYVDSIIDEYNSKKLKERKNKLLINFEFKPEENIDKFEESLFDYKYEGDFGRDDKFNKIIFSLIKYNKCLNLVEKLESNKSDQTFYYNELDQLINKNEVNKGLKNGMKILRNIILEKK